MVPDGSQQPLLGAVQYQQVQYQQSWPYLLRRPWTHAVGNSLCRPLSSWMGLGSDLSSSSTWDCHHSCHCPSPAWVLQGCTPTVVALLILPCRAALPLLAPSTALWGRFAVTGSCPFSSQCLSVDEHTHTLFGVHLLFQHEVEIHVCLLSPPFLSVSITCDDFSQRSPQISLLGCVLLSVTGKNRTKFWWGLLP